MTLPLSTAYSADLDVDLSEPPDTFPGAEIGAIKAHLTVDLTQEGKQHGHLVLPAGESAVKDGHIRIPVCIVKGKEDGPTITMIAGVHGDEFEGPITLQRLAKELSSDAIKGRIILLPSINPQALTASTRYSPVDNRDMDLCFPGSPFGTQTQQMAFQIFQKLIRPADLVIDLRSGGSSLLFAPTVAMRTANGRRQLHKPTETPSPSAISSEEAMFAFGAPNCARLPASAPNSCLQGAVEAVGISYIQTELGGGAGCSAETLSIAHVGCMNVLRRAGNMDEDVQLRSSRIVEVRDASFYVHAQHSGLLALHARLGANVYRGDELASIFTTDESGTAGHRIDVPKNSVLLAVRHGGRVKAGDLVAILADEVPQ